MDRTTGRAVVIVVALASAFVGPRLLQKGDAPAGAPFHYTPPADFAHVPDRSGVTDPNTWVYAPAASTARFPARYSISHTKSSGLVEPNDLAKIAAGMPEVFRSSGIAWAFARSETRERADGARYGVIEGNASKATKEGGELGVNYVVRQFVFPDDDGTSIVTASYPRDEMSKWEATFDAAALSATGVARKAPGIAGSSALMWGAGGGMLGALLVMVFVNRKGGVSGAAAKGGSADT